MPSTAKPFSPIHVGHPTISERLQTRITPRRQANRIVQVFRGHSSSMERCHGASSTGGEQEDYLPNKGCIVARRVLSFCMRGASRYAITIKCAARRLVLKLWTIDVVFVHPPCRVSTKTHYPPACGTFATTKEYMWSKCFCVAQA